jgi:hypothetical protein
MGKRSKADFAHRLVLCDVADKESQIFGFAKTLQVQDQLQIKHKPAILQNTCCKKPLFI